MFPIHIISLYALHVQFIVAQIYLHIIHCQKGKNISWKFTEEKSLYSGAFMYRIFCQEWGGCYLSDIRFWGQEPPPPPPSSDWEGFIFPPWEFKAKKISDILLFFLSRWGRGRRDRLYPIYTPAPHPFYTQPCIQPNCTIVCKT